MAGAVAAVMVAFVLVATAPSGTAGPNCGKTPQAGPCRLSPSPSTTPTASPTPSGASVAPPPGTTDAVALAAWIQALPAGSTADLTGRSFTAEKGARIDGQTGLTILGGTFVRSLSDPATSTNFPNPLLWLYGCSGCTVQGTVFRGNNTVSDMSYAPEYGAYLGQFELDAALRVERFTDVTVTGIDVDAVWGDGIQLQIGDGATVTGSRIDRIGRQGVTVIASRVLVDGVRVEHGRRSGFDLEPDSATQSVHGIEIRNSYTKTIGLAFASGGRGAVHDVWLHDNTTAGSSVPVVYVVASDGATRANWRVERITALDGLGSPAAALRFSHVVGLTVTGVRLPVADSQSRLAFDLNDCGGAVSITGSDFGQAAYYRNTAPRAGLTLDLSGNSPPLTEVP